MKLFWTLFVLLTVVSPLLPVIENADKPLKGAWDFQMEKTWEIRQAKNDVFARPWQILVSDKGFVYLYDSKNRKNYIFDKQGKFIKTFAQRGEGPGEIKSQTMAFLVNDKVVIPDVGKVHYFSENGDYITSVKKKHSLHPALFINEDEFVSAPISIFQAFDGKGKICRVNLKTGRETPIAEFAVFRGGYGKSAGGNVYDTIARGLTPMMTIGLGNNRLYYGMSDSYEITIIDLKGKKYNSFILEREKRKVSAKDKRKRFIDNDSRIPVEAKREICNSLPDEIACFDRIEIHNGLLYVFVADIEHWKEGKRAPKQVDIFSLDGRYLYRSFIRFGGKKNLVFSPFPILVIKGSYLYAALEDEDGEIMITKYRITLPR